MNIKQTYKTYNVAVCGGGIAGIAAALAAAREGAKTVLLEKEYCLGGLATLGLIVVYLPLCDGMGIQMSSGICEELALLSVKYGGAENVPLMWISNAGNSDETALARRDTRYQIQYNAASMMMAAEELLIQNGVDILYDVRLSDSCVKNGKITSVTVETKCGKLVVEAQAFVDATGDADLCYFSGEETYDCDDNRRTGWYYSYGENGLKLNELSDPLYGEIPAGSRSYSGTNLEDISNHMLDMRRFIADDLQKKHKNGDSSAYPLIIPSYHGLRTTRRLAGTFEFSEELHENVYFHDAIGMIGNWKKRGPRYTIPYRSIKGAHCSNLYAAGRCTSADKSGWDLTRVIPSCAVTGEAAGCAAAMQSARGTATGIRELQAELISRGVLLDKNLFEKFM